MILFSLTIHEYCHGFVAYRLGDPTAKSNGRLSLNPLKHLDPLGTLFLLVLRIGWAKPVPIDPRYFRNPQRGMMYVGLAGPISNFVMAAISAFLAKSIGILSGSFIIPVLLITFAYNVALGVFNLIPIPPLDGSRVIGGFLPRHLYYDYIRLERWSLLIFIAVFFFFREALFGILIPIFNFITGVFLPGFTWFELFFFKG